MYRVLLIEDSKESQLVVERALADGWIELTKAGTIAEAKFLLQEHSRAYFDLILLDLSLPDGHGLSIFREQEDAEMTPIFLFTSEASIESKIDAFNLGVDDYLVKPVNPLELRSRVMTRLRKAKIQRSNASRIWRGNILLDATLLRAFLSEDENMRELELTSTEFKLLYFLVRHEREVFARSTLMREIWGEKVHVLERTVDSHMSALRRKLGPAARHLESIPGSGYRFSL